MSFYSQKIIEHLWRALDVLSFKRGEDLYLQMGRHTQTGPVQKKPKRVLESDAKALKMHRATHHESTIRHH